jgi:hypothetical protein
VLAGHFLGGVLEPRAVVGRVERVVVDKVRLDLTRAVLGLNTLQPDEGGRGFR